MSQLTAPALAPLAVRLHMQFPTCEVLFLGFSSCGVRLTIDHPDGVTAQLTARIAHALKPLVPGWGLEVSSPGPRRPLHTPAHFQRAVGRRIRLKTMHGTEHGTVIQADERGFIFDAETRGEQSYMYADVQSARMARQTK